MLFARQAWHHQMPAGVVTGGKVYFQPGSNPGPINIYDLAANTVAASGSMSFTQSQGYGFGCYSSKTNGYMENGYYSAALSQSFKINYSNDTFATAGAVMGPAQDNQAGLSNPTYGVVAGGGNQIADTNAKNTYKRLFSTDAVSSWTALSTVRDQTILGFGTGTVGYVSGGDSNAAQSTYVATTDKFNYSSAAISAGGSMATGRGSAQAFGNTTTAVVAGGYTGSGYLSSVELYGYGSDTYSAGTALSANLSNMGAGSNGTTGLLGCGYDGVNVTASSKLYNFTGGSWSAGATFAIASQVTWACGPTCGGLQ